MHWILIYWLAVSGSAMTTGSVRFDDEAACHAAFKEMVKVNTGSSAALYGACVLESTPK
jgi:hypothetical protein